MSRFVEVAFNLPIRKSFTYASKEGMPRGIGWRVSAPFGKRKLAGYIVAERDAPPPGIGEVREIARIIDERPVFNEQILSLAGWMSRIYMCSMGEALSTMIPAGRREVESEEFPLDEEPNEYPLAEQQLAAIRTDPGAGQRVVVSFRGHGIRKDGRLSPRGAGDRLPGTRGDLSRPGNRPHAPGGQEVHLGVPGSARGPALVTHPFPEAETVVPRSRWRSGCRHRRAERDLCAISPPRFDRHRRGARRLLQILHHPALPRPSGGDVPGFEGRHAAAHGKRDAVAGGLAPHERGQARFPSAAGSSERRKDA